MTVKAPMESLEDIIIESGLKIEVIAKRMDITANYFWRLRQKPRDMDVVFMEKLAGVLGVEVDRVFNAIKNQTY